MREYVVEIVSLNGKNAINVRGHILSSHLKKIEDALSGVINKYSVGTILTMNVLIEEDDI